MSNSDSNKELRAENYINNMISTMMSISAVLATISVGVLAILEKHTAGIIKLLIIFFILISVVLFIYSFWRGMKSYGILILALISNEDAIQKAREPTWFTLKIMIAGLISLVIACVLFFIGCLCPYVNISLIDKILKIPQFWIKIIITFGLSFIVIGTIGMIIFVKKFPFSTNVKDLKLTPGRFLGLDGYRVWLFSIILIILGSMIQILTIWITK